MLMHVCDAGGGACDETERGVMWDVRFSCNKCGCESEWLRMMLGIGTGAWAGACLWHVVSPPQDAWYQLPLMFSSIATMGLVGFLAGFGAHWLIGRALQTGSD